MNRAYVVAAIIIIDKEGRVLSLLNINMLGTVPNVLHTSIYLFLTTVLQRKILSSFITEEPVAQGRVSSIFFEVKKPVSLEEGRIHN